MNEQTIVVRVIRRLFELDMSKLSDDELLAIAGGELTEDERQFVRQVSSGRTDVLTELTDDELERLVKL